MRVLFVDNFDSFTYNVVHLLASQGFEPEIVLSDDPGLTPHCIEGFGALVIGPGPGNPSQTPRVVDVIRSAAHHALPVFGVCFGLQAIGAAFGARVVHAPKPMHGKTSFIRHDGDPLFDGVPSPFTATRYHSLCLAPESIPDDLHVVARSEDGVVQAIVHRTLPIVGVQFHPESVLSEHGARIFRNALQTRVC
jgi:anthranilate synthase/aminodeoxychorismate synthase-like glutamine amidotransferase